MNRMMSDERPSERKEKAKKKRSSSIDSSGLKDRRQILDIYMYAAALERGR